MTVVPPKVVPPKVAPKKPGPAPDAKKAPPLDQKKIVKKKRSFFLAGDVVNLDFVPNEEVENARHKRVHRILYFQTAVIAFLTAVMILSQPVLRPIYHYYARNPDGGELALNALMMPNITNRALLSWAVTSVTEIMTFGFGDVVEQLGKQKSRFTRAGWDSFVNAFRKQRIKETFQENQLVVTTVPSNTPVVVAQGINEWGVYQWLVQVPVVMTYATNNNVTQAHHGVISLTITRVSPQEFPAGIAIRKWVVDR